MATSNVTTAAETNLIKQADLKRVREIEFFRKFGLDGITKLMEALSVTRKIPMQEGTTLYMYDMVSEGLVDGNVPEGEIIPLTKIEQTKVPVGEITLMKHRKAASAESIKKSGYQTAVVETDEKLLKLVQQSIRNKFFTFLGNLNNTTAVTDTTLQGVLAGTWGQLQVLFEDDAIVPVHFVNPLDIADYLKSASITLQTAFGLNYLEDFLGLGRVILTNKVPKGTVYSTAQDNLIMYYLTTSGDVAMALNLATDQTGLIGINSGYLNEERAQLESLVVYGIDLLVEYAAGVVVGTINP